MTRSVGRLDDMTAKLGRHRADAASSVPRPRTTSPTGSRTAAHRGGRLALLGTGLLALAVVAALTIVLLGLVR